ncbi:hypothetical protein AYI70_g5903, partial [Smittium culicis]
MSSTAALDVDALLSTYLKTHNGLPANQLSALIVASLNHYRSSKADKNAKAEKLLEHWSSIINSKCIYPPILTPQISSQFPSITPLLDSNSFLLIYLLSFDTIVKFCSNLFCKKIPLQNSSTNKNQSLEWEYSFSVRKNAIDLWSSLMKKPILIFNPPSPSHSSIQNPEFNPNSLFSTINAYFLHPKNYNFLAYCICGLLDNSSDPTQPEVSEISLDVLLNLLSQNSKNIPH